MQINNFKTYSISNILIALSFITTSIVISVPEYYAFGINIFFLEEGFIYVFIFQLFAGVFMHGGILHLIANSLFIYLFGNVVEVALGMKKYILFILSSIIFTGISLVLFSSGNTVGISGVAMSLLGFYTICLYIDGNSDYKGGITAIILNVAIGLSPGISLVGHLSGVIIGIIFGVIFKHKNIFFKK